MYNMQQGSICEGSIRLPANVSLKREDTKKRLTH